MSGRREYLCTTCSQRKRRTPGLLPAGRRYLSPRLRAVLRDGARRRTPVVILSGKFGLLAPEEPIPWYDAPLTAAGARALVPTVAAQLRRLRAGRLELHAEPRRTPGWAPYYDLLESACRTAGVELSVAAAK